MKKLWLTLLFALISWNYAHAAAVWERPQLAENVARALYYQIDEGAPKFAAEAMRESLRRWNALLPRGLFFVELVRKDTDKVAVVKFEWTTKKFPVAGALGYTKNSIVNNYIVSSVVQINAGEFKWPHAEFSLMRVLCHEIGHVLGLDHDDSDERNLMYSQQHAGPCRGDCDVFERIYKERNRQNDILWGEKIPEPKRSKP